MYVLILNFETLEYFILRLFHNYDQDRAIADYYRKSTHWNRYCIDTSGPLGSVNIIIQINLKRWKKFKQPKIYTILPRHSAK